MRFQAVWMGLAGAALILTAGLGVATTHTEVQLPISGGTGPEEQRAALKKSLESVPGVAVTKVKRGSVNFQVTEGKVALTALASALAQIDNKQVELMRLKLKSAQSIELVLNDATKDAVTDALVVERLGRVRDIASVTNPKPRHFEIQTKSSGLSVMTLNIYLCKPDCPNPLVPDHYVEDILWK